jgi:hypothetical protein
VKIAQAAVVRISVKSLTAILDGNNPAVGQGASEGSWTISNVQIVQTLRSVQAVYESSRSIRSIGGFG